MRGAEVPGDRHAPSQIRLQDWDRVAQAAAPGCFLADGEIEIDSNAVERAIRPRTITRENSLFAGSDGGGHTWATIAVC